jgi:ABC-type nitrate/sulfonate/bicarbonate transport system permease component
MANSLILIPIGIAAYKYSTDEDAGIVESAVWGAGVSFGLMVLGFFLGVFAGVPLGG